MWLMCLQCIRTHLDLLINYDSETMNYCIRKHIFLFLPVVDRLHDVLFCDTCCSFASSLLGFSLSLNTGNLAGDIFVNMIISASMEIPAMFLVAFLLNVKILGRRINCSATFILPGLGCLLCVLLTLLSKY